MFVFILSWMLESNNLGAHKKISCKAQKYLVNSNQYSVARCTDFVLFCVVLLTQYFTSHAIYHGYEENLGKRVLDLAKSRRYLASSLTTSFLAPSVICMPLPYLVSLSLGKNTSSSLAFLNTLSESK